jgi:hypothetical protein
MMISRETMSLLFTAVRIDRGRRMSDVIRGPDRKKAALELFGRVRRLLLSPASEFARLATERETLKALAIGWIVPLALVTVVVQSVRAYVVGIPLQGIDDYYPPDLVEVPLFAGPLFLESIAMPFVGGAVISALARYFAGQPNYVEAVRTAAYASTPAWLVGMLWQAWETGWTTAPPLSIYLFIGGLWSMYLLFRGLPPMMSSPPSKAVTYTLAVSAVLAVVWILALVVTYQIIHGLHSAYILSGEGEY